MSFFLSYFYRAYAFYLKLPLHVRVLLLLAGLFIVALLAVVVRGPLPEAAGPTFTSPAEPTVSAPAQAQTIDSSEVRPRAYCELHDPEYHRRYFAERARMDRLQKGAYMEFEVQYRLKPPAADCVEFNRRFTE